MSRRGKGPWPSNNTEQAVKAWFLERIDNALESDEKLPVADLALEHITQQTKGYRISMSYKYSESEIDRLAVVAEDVALGIPIQYALGQTHFAGLTINTQPGVLIPRPETEELVAAFVVGLGDGFNGEVLDIGTGSGCIALGVKDRVAKAKVFAVDISSDALDIAMRNSDSLGLEVEFECSNVLCSLPFEGKTFDAVISNPPYIPEREKASIESRVKDFEPKEALFVPDEDPLLFYNRIITMCEEGMLKQGGLMGLECHFEYAKEVFDILHASSSWENVELIVDLNGKARHVMAVRSYIKS